MSGSSRTSAPSSPNAALGDWNEVRALVFGASGFMGRWVSYYLTQAGAVPILVVRDRSTTRDGMSTHELRTADLRDPETVTALVAAEQPDIVFNMAGYGVDRTERDEEEARLLNAVLPDAIAAACAALPPSSRWTGVRLVHIGSALEYGITGGYLSETSELQPTTVYGRTKLAGTRAIAQVAAATGLPAVTARLFTVFGPGEHGGRLFPSLVTAAGSNEAISLSSGMQRRDFAFIGDVCDALLALARAPVVPGEAVNVASGTMWSVRDFALAAADALGIAHDRLHFGAVPVRPEEMSHDGVVVERMRALLGYALPSDLPNVIRRAVEALGSHPRHH